MRIALFSDIHSNYHALEAVLLDMAGRGVDRLICLGDITMKGPLPRECVDRVRELGCPVALGNTDSCYHPDLHPDRFTVQNRSQAAARDDFGRHMAALPGANPWKCVESGGNEKLIVERPSVAVGIAAAPGRPGTPAQGSEQG